ncbi:MAG: DUF488 domain-containing protein [Rickettsiales bacterium]|nr:DUF488 domain-containing protein [Rickettsiales bacterium]
MLIIYTIGFSGKNQEEFFEILRGVGVKKLIDIRLWRVARFVPWASGVNLQKHLGDKYIAMPELAPTKELLTAYKDGTIDWQGYEKVFNGLICERKIEKLFTVENLDGMCFLCSEKNSEKCHRRLVAEYLSVHFDDVTIVHL